MMIACVGSILSTHHQHNTGKLKQDMTCVGVNSRRTASVNGHQNTYHITNRRCWYPMRVNESCMPIGQADRKSCLVFITWFWYGIGRTSKGNMHIWTSVCELHKSRKKAILHMHMDFYHIDERRPNWILSGMCAQSWNESYGSRLWFVIHVY